MSDTVQQIKERLNIQDVVAPYVKLRRAGRSLVGLCPFHKEKTGSFHVSSERGSFHCFGCGVGGDAFSFIEKIEGVDFKGALKILAEKAGVELAAYSGQDRAQADKKDRLRALMSRASEWYAGQLPQTEAQAYAKTRGLLEKTVADWRIGYAPEGWRALLEAMTAEGFSVPELLAAGLVKEADGKKGTYYDRFRNRLVFPIRDPAGRVVGFTGRDLSDDGALPAGRQAAKYLNSPETELYRKSEVLFGMDKAKDAIRTRGFTMLVEGQMDVLLTHQAGFENAVALSGTALTERHLALMKRYSDNLMLVLDADAAGLSATAKSAALALRLGLRVKAARLPRGKDPADLIREDAKEFARRIKEGKPIVEFFLTEFSERERSQERLHRLVHSVVYPLLAAIQSTTERGLFESETARYLDGVSAKDVHDSVSLILRDPSRRQDIPNPAPSAQRLRTTRELQLLALINVYEGTELADKVKTAYSRITEAPALPPAPIPESVLFEIEQMFGESPAEDAADELLAAFEETVVREAYDGAVTALRRAEATGDPAEVRQAEQACGVLSARLGALHAGRRGLKK